MNVTLYGSSRSRASRALWLLRELDIPFNHIEDKASSSINPNQKIPSLTVQENGKQPFHLYESLAITTYLAKKCQKFHPKTVEEEALVEMWSLWVITECEMSLLGLLMGSPQSDELKKKLVRPLTALNTELEGKSYLIGDRFTVADLNVVSIIGAWGRKFDYSPYPNVARYLKACMARPAFSPKRSAKM